MPTNHLNTEHVAELEILSAIDPTIIAQRGYRTVHDIRELPAEFANYQARAGLLIPIRSVRGAIESYQLKPFSPRINAQGKPIKYETAANASQIIDVPENARKMLGDPKLPLVITEGAKKVDAAISAGLWPTIGLQGVYGWRGKNADGGKTALADWEEIALNGREVLIAFDSDVMSKPSVRDALDRLAAFLRGKGALVRYLLMPDLDDGAKCGLDDWFALGKDLETLSTHIVEQLPALSSPSPARGDAAPGNAGDESLATMPSLSTRFMSDIETKQIDWLWPNWLPKGMLTLLGGYAGDGKSTFTMALAAALSTGGALPDGTAAPLTNTLLVAAEDDVSHVIKGRLEAHHADARRIVTLDHVNLPDGGQRSFNLRTDVPLLRQEVEKNNIGLIVIDPLSSALANGDRNSEGDVRDTLQPLVKMMEETGVTTIGIMHIGKTEGRARAMQNLMGSTAFSALARSIWMVNELPEEFQFPDQPTRKMIGVGKSNYAVPPHPISFSRPLDAALEFHGFSPVGLEEVFNWKKKQKGGDDAGPSATDRAEEWLLEFMDGKRVLASDVEAAAKVEGFAPTTIKRAKLKLGISSKKENQQWFWSQTGSSQEMTG